MIRSGSTGQSMKSRFTTTRSAQTKSPRTTRLEQKDKSHESTFHKSSKHTSRQYGLNTIIFTAKAFVCGRTGFAPRWLAYTLASAATVFTGAHSAQADIHYSGILDERFPKNVEVLKFFPLDKPGDSLLLEHTDGAAYVKILPFSAGSVAGYLSFDQFFASRSSHFGRVPFDGHVCLRAARFLRFWPQAAAGNRRSRAKVSSDSSLMAGRALNTGGLELRWAARLRTTGLS